MRRNAHGLVARLAPSTTAAAWAVMLTGVVAAAPGHLGAQGDLKTWTEVGRILKTAAVPSAGYQRYNFPRRDLTVRMGDVTVATAMAFGSWAGFSGEPANATLMGDLVLTPAELKPVQAEMARQGIDIAAVHNHLTGESPEVIYMHYHAHGAALDLARKLDAALAVTATPRPVTGGAAPPVTIDTATVFRMLGTSGKAQGNVAQVSYMLVTGAVTMGGTPLVPAMAYGSPVNVQAVSASRFVATGDFAVTARQLDPLVRGLVTHGITATAVHTHLVDDAPRIYFVHFWADGAPAAVLGGIRAAVDAAK